MKTPFHLVCCLVLVLGIGCNITDYPVIVEADAGRGLVALEPQIIEWTRVGGQVSGEMDVRVHTEVRNPGGQPVAATDVDVILTITDTLANQAP